MKLSEHFDKNEFRCQCGCGGEKMLTEKLLSRPGFEKIIDDACNKSSEDLFVIFAAAHTRKELEKTKPEINLLQIEPGWSGDFVWLYDWDEGQQFFKFYGIFTEPELLAVIFKEVEK